MALVRLLCAFQSLSLHIFDSCFAFTGTDATIAEHIAKIIARQYVMEQNQSGIKYLAPSNLGIALVEGSNAIGFDRSLVKPHLRREVRVRSCLARKRENQRANQLYIGAYTDGASNAAHLRRCTDQERRPS
jgi:hypothetical protein